MMKLFLKEIYFSLFYPRNLKNNNMEKYISLLNPSKIKADFLLEFLLLFSGDSSEHNEASFKTKKYRNFCYNITDIRGLTQTQHALMHKIAHMMDRGAGLKDVVIMLNSFSRGTKRLQSNRNDSDHCNQYDYTNKDGNEKLSHSGNLPKGHFRWDFGKRYTLPTEDLEKISLFIQPLVKHL